MEREDLLMALDAGLPQDQTLRDLLIIFGTQFKDLLLAQEDLKTIDIHLLIQTDKIQIHTFTMVVLLILWNILQIYKNNHILDLLEILDLHYLIWLMLTQIEL